jgi:glycosyltransferase involved in cell wall biosynthesis
LNTDWELNVLLVRGGPRLAAYQKLCRTWVLKPQWREALPRGLSAVVRGPVLRGLQRGWERWIGIQLSRNAPTIIYGNSLAIAPAVPLLSPLATARIVHVRELESMIADDGRIGLVAFERVRQFANQFLAVSRSVKDNLVTRHGVPADRILISPGCLETATPLHFQEDVVRKRVRAELGIPSSADIVCGAGTLDLRKGADLFLAAARHVVARLGTSAPYFLWIGGNLTSEFGRHLMLDAEKLAIRERIRLLPQRPDIAEYLAASDLLIVPSREDPFPLVVLEAASLGKPVVCFDKSGGAPDFVEGDCGFVVAYLDVAAMGDRIVELVRDPALRSRLGENAARKVRERHDIAVEAIRFKRILETAARLGEPRVA